MQYFEHSTHAADDDSIMALRLEMGGAAVDCYWVLLEKMYRDEAAVNLFGTDGETNVETKSVSHRLCIGSDELKKYVLKMLELGLFEGTLENITSKRAMKNIEKYQKRAETARQNGKSGGRKPNRKPSRNPVGFKVGTNAETNVGVTKQNKTKDIGSDKTEPISKGAGGADAHSAPPAPECPTCGAQMNPTNSFTAGKRRRIYRCPLCSDTREVEVA